MARTTKVRPITIKTADLAGALERAEPIAKVWQARYPNGDYRWQTQAVEMVMLPQVWRQIARVNGRSYYETVERVEGYGLPGYVMRPWNSEPRDSWQAAHSATVVYNGMRRELCGDLGYALQCKALEVTGRSAYEPGNNSYADQILAHWGIRIA